MGINVNAKAAQRAMLDALCAGLLPFATVCKPQSRPLKVLVRSTHRVMSRQMFNAIATR